MVLVATFGWVAATVTDSVRPVNASAIDGSCARVRVELCEPQSAPSAAGFVPQYVVVRLLEATPSILVRPTSVFPRVSGRLNVVLPLPLPYRKNLAVMAPDVVALLDSVTDVLVLLRTVVPGAKHDASITPPILIC